MWRGYGATGYSAWGAASLRQAHRDGTERLNLGALNTRWLPRACALRAKSRASRGKSGNELKIRPSVRRSIGPSVHRSIGPSVQVQTTLTVGKPV